MEEPLYTFLLWARLIAYPTASYALISLAISRRGKSSSRETSAYLMVAGIFMVLWIALIARRLFGVTGDVIQIFFDSVLTPLLVTVTFLALRSMMTTAHASVEKIERRINGNNLVSNTK